MVSENYLKEFVLNRVSFVVIGEYHELDDEVFFPPVTPGKVENCSSCRHQNTPCRRARILNFVCSHYEP